MSNRLLRQEEIDALLNAQVSEPAQPAPAVADFLDEQDQEIVTEENSSGGQEPEAVAAGLIADQAKADQAQVGLISLKEEEKDALGEVGNICMGSAATTLSMLLNQKVSITSPRITVTTIEELFESFTMPHMTIFVRYTEGLSGFNILIMKVQDASVLADLMMGGDGTNVVEELAEIGVSAASEAMNQMIGSASTAMASMFNRTVNISPPQTKIFRSAEDLRPPEFGQEGPVVVVWFKMTVGSILDTQIMQVIGFDTAREQAGMILGQLSGTDEETPSPSEEENKIYDLAESADRTGSPEMQDDLGDVLVQEPTGPEPFSVEEQIVQKGSPDLAKPAYTSNGVRPSAPARSAVTPAGFDQQRLDLILDIPLKVSVILGRTRWPIKDILGLSPGSVVEMQSLVDEPVEVLVNGTLVATGEVVVVNENFGVRITNIIGPEERIQNLGR